MIGSNHTTNEENYLLQKFARTVLRTNHIDHHRTADFPALMSALANGTETPLARANDLAQASAILLVGNDPTDQHPMLAWKIREACRLRGARLYVVNSRRIPLIKQSHQFLPVPAGEEPTAIASLLGDAEAERVLAGKTSGGETVTLERLQAFRDSLQAEQGVIIVFGAEIVGEAVSALVRFGEKLPGRTRYIALGDYSNSRGAADMGLLPHLLPGYRSVEDAAARGLFEQAWKCSIPAASIPVVSIPAIPGWSREEMVGGVRDGKLSALYVVGANPLKGQDPAEYRGRSFLVAQDLFLHETAEAADVFLPAASAYEKSGSVTNTCGELQRLRKATDVPGTRTDLDILARLAGAMGATGFSGQAEEVLEEIRRLVPGYQIPLVQLLAGGAEPTLLPAEAATSAWDGQGRIESARIESAIKSANDTLFTSGTMGRYSRILGLVPERRR